ncbi:RidA family protein [Paenibacillus sp. 7124]|uniref:RidA family protein n=1 Tax=Paenibacillus apii TaxID=1850370 RepID=A0A6M1PMB1_9BACL|nr:RidA family protein [Paenibacillus apii]NGM84410.1 RidA family protein [Paenibacillus apii]NJJ38360.1 RidA family protein [Paenibacillus apii]
MSKKQVATSKAPGAIGPYSQAIIAGNWVYTSGQLGLNPETGELAGDVQAQARQSLANVQAILEEAGTSLDHVVKTTVFLKDMNDFAAVNEVYSSFFSEPYPARSAVEVARLPKDGLVEIEVVARRK